MRILLYLIALILTTSCSVSPDEQKENFEYCIDNVYNNIAHYNPDSIKVLLKKSDRISEEFLEHLHKDMPEQFHENLIPSLKISENATQSDNYDYLSQNAYDEKMSKFFDFYVGNSSSISYNLETAIEYKNRTFIRFIATTFLSNIAAVSIISFGILIALAPMLIIALFIKNNEASDITITLAAISTIFSGIVQAFIWVVWGLYCACMVNYYIESPFIVHDWLYYIIGFGSLISPIQFFATKELSSAQGYARKDSIENGTILYKSITIISYILFLVFESLGDFSIISWTKDYFFFV